MYLLSKSEKCKCNSAWCYFNWTIRTHCLIFDSFLRVVSEFLIGLCHHGSREGKSLQVNKSEQRQNNVIRITKLVMFLLGLSFTLGKKWQQLKNLYKLHKLIDNQSWQHTDSQFILTPSKDSYCRLLFVNNGLILHSYYKVISVSIIDLNMPSYILTKFCINSGVIAWHNDVRMQLLWTDNYLCNY